MLKRRVAAVEKRLAGLGGTAEKNLRIVYQFDGDPEPMQGPDENLLVIQVINTRGENTEAQKREKDGPVVFKMPRPETAEDERVFRFDFGSGEGQTRRVNKETNDAADNSLPTGIEKGRK